MHKMLQATALRRKFFSVSYQFRSISALSLILILLAPSYTSLAQSNSPATSSQPRTASNQLRTEKHKGDTVKEHARKMRIKNKGFDRAMKDFEKQGRKPDWEGSLSAQGFVVNPVAGVTRGQLRRVSFAPQDSLIEGEYEMTFITFEGSDLDNWSGLIYIRTPYEDDVYTASFSTPSDDSSTWLQVSEFYYPPDGREPVCGGSMFCPEMPITNGQISKHSAHGASRKATATNATVSHKIKSTAAPGFWSRISRWWGCTVLACTFTGCSGGNVFTRFICRVHTCAYAVFGCLFY